MNAKDTSVAFAAALVGITNINATSLDGFLIMHRSGAGPGAAAILREQIEI